jgi:hypothetical protein
MTGDWRSGQELLDQADFDFRTDLSRSWAKFGPSLMQHISSKCQQFEEDLRTHGQAAARPASPRCIRPRDPPPLLSGDAAGLGLGPAGCPTPPNMQISARWARGPLQPLWALGYRRDALAAIFDALPPGLLHPLSRALHARDSLDARRRAALRAAHGAPAPAPAGSGGAAAEGGGGADGLGEGDPGGLWEAEAEAGFLSVSYDGATGRRLCVGMNRRQAELMGVRRREALERLAAHAAPLPAPQADLVAWIAHELDRPAQVRE